MMALALSLAVGPLLLLLGAVMMLFPFLIKVLPMPPPIC